MKFKRIIGLVSAVSIICSACAFAETSKTDTQESTGGGTKVEKNYLFLEDFTSTDAGSVPGTIGATDSDGHITTGIEDIGGGKKKNVLQIVDTSSQKDYKGPNARLNMGTYSKDNGIISIEMRFKYIPDASSPHMNFLMSFSGSTGQLTRTYAASDNGAFQINGGGEGQQMLKNGKLTPDVWHTYKLYIDFEKQQMDVYLKEEAPEGMTTAFANVPFFEKKEFTDVSRIDIQSQCYGGTLYYDYIKVSKEAARLDVIAIEEESYKNLKKGVEQTKIPAPVSKPVKDRINIKMDGVYKYTTTAPVLSGENVLVSAKNVGNFFGMAYDKTDAGFILKDDKNELIFSANGSGATNNAKQFNLSANCVVSGNQLMIPIADVAALLGYETSFNAETNELTITTGASAPAAE